MSNKIHIKWCRETYGLLDTKHCPILQAFRYWGQVNLPWGLVQYPTCKHMTHQIGFQDAPYTSRFWAPRGFWVLKYQDDNKLRILDNDLFSSSFEILPTGPWFPFADMGQEQ